MAATWRATAQDVAFANAKSMLDIFNASGSGRVLRIRRVYQFNNVPIAVTGVLTTMRLVRTSGPATGGSTITPVAHNTVSAALPAQVTAGTDRTNTDVDLFRQYLWSNDEPAITIFGLDEWECMVPFAEVWDAGYGDSDVQPIVCREVQGFHIKHQGSTTVSQTDLEIEFTNEAS